MMIMAEKVTMYMRMSDDVAAKVESEISMCISWTALNIRKNTN